MRLGLRLHPGVAARATPKIDVKSIDNRIVDATIWQESLAISVQGGAKIPRAFGDQTVIDFMTYRGYTARMTFDADDKVIIGRVLGIADIISFHGESIAEFERAFQVALDDYISSCEELGDTPEKPASGRLTRRGAPEVQAAAMKAASLSGVSLNKGAERASTIANRNMPAAKKPAIASESPPVFKRTARKRTAGKPDIS